MGVGSLGNGFHGKLVVHGLHDAVEAAGARRTRQTDDSVSQGLFPPRCVAEVGVGLAEVFLSLCEVDHLVSFLRHVDT
eukprot:CAMPEP_0118997604 /NCGR_PEP_ID=MMETSP1173-20130426/62038_1 /TAXON_ID=1034831 /ORGANISM="Rhizochromulina marina cf, Strain CCMP1243" /LENGTH=77 /DNA_ID=CAMNT_0006949061 /DNA_START=146 /DNA_END=379 /DNA_ORIENTATION=-